jgi:hypothetical protein
LKGDKKMKALHECEKNIPRMDMEIYSYDKGENKAWYIGGHIIFYCPYCGVESNKLAPAK